MDLHSFDDELKFAEIDDLNAALQIRLLRACLYLRSHAVPIMYQAVKKAFPLPDDLYEDHQQHAISTSTTTNIGEIDHKNITKTTLFTDSTGIVLYRYIVSIIRIMHFIIIIYIYQYIYIITNSFYNVNIYLSDYNYNRSY